MEYYNEELKFRKETKMLTLTISIQYHIGSLSHTNHTREKNNWILKLEGKRLKLSLFADKIILYREL